MECFKHICSLRSDEMPNYAYLPRLFCSLFLRYGFEYDYVFDRITIKFLEQLERNEKPGDG